MEALQPKKYPMQNKTFLLSFNKARTTTYNEKLKSRWKHDHTIKALPNYSYSYWKQTVTKVHRIAKD